jgi:pSer/pThr/pTyr-binding forkhead associated (FHA) protein
VIGRDADCDVVVRSFACSRRHAKLVVEAGKVRILDLKSKGGTQVSGKPVVEGPVASGDELRLGQMLFRFVEGVVHPVTGRTYG